MFLLFSLCVLFADQTLPDRSKFGQLSQHGRRSAHVADRLLRSALILLKGVNQNPADLLIQLLVEVRYRSSEISHIQTHVGYLCRLEAAIPSTPARYANLICVSWPAAA